MGKVPIRLKEVAYTLSPFEQNVMSGLWKDVTNKVMHQLKEVGHMRCAAFTSRTRVYGFQAL